MLENALFVHTFDYIVFDITVTKTGWCIIVTFSLGYNIVPIVVSLHFEVNGIKRARCFCNFWEAIHFLIDPYCQVLAYLMIC